VDGLNARSFLSLSPSTSLVGVLRDDARAAQLRGFVGGE
jgi:hypothetical protein